MSPQNGRRENGAKYMLIADPMSWAESGVPVALYWNIVSWRDFLPIPNGSAVPYVFGAISSSSILRAYLYTTHSSVVCSKMRKIDHEFKDILGTYFQNIQKVPLMTILKEKVSPLICLAVSSKLTYIFDI